MPAPPVRSQVFTATEGSTSATSEHRMRAVPAVRWIYLLMVFLQKTPAVTVGQASGLSPIPLRARGDPLPPPNQPHHKRQNGANHQTRHNRKIKCRIPPPNHNIPRQPA